MEQKLTYAGLQIGSSVGESLDCGTSAITITHLELEIYLLLHLSVCSKMKKNKNKTCDHNFLNIISKHKDNDHSKEAEHN